MQDRKNPRSFICPKEWVDLKMWPSASRLQVFSSYFQQFLAFFETVPWEDTSRLANEDWNILKQVLFAFSLVIFFLHMTYKNNFILNYFLFVCLFFYNKPKGVEKWSTWQFLLSREKVFKIPRVFVSFTARSLFELSSTPCWKCWHKAQWRTTQILFKFHLMSCWKER